MKIVGNSTNTSQNGILNEYTIGIFHLNLSAIFARNIWRAKRNPYTGHLWTAPQQTLISFNEAAVNRCRLKLRCPAFIVKL